MEKLIKEQDWKNTHISSHNAYSALVYIVFAVIILYGFYQLCKCFTVHWKRSKNLRAIAAAATDHIGLSTDTTRTKFQE
jgi:hypothetical protein